MPSSVIRRFVYDTDKGELWIEFVSGRRYVYSEVPDSVADELDSAPSKGTYFNARIRDHYRYREVRGEKVGTES